VTIKLKLESPKIRRTKELMLDKNETKKFNKIEIVPLKTCAKIEIIKLK
jgi:hypothetical protein